MRNKKWWIIGGSALTALFLNYRSTFVEAFIYAGATKALDFILGGAWPYVLGIFAVVGIGWLLATLRTRDTIVLVAAANPRIASALELQRQSRRPWGTWLTVGAVIAILFVAASWSVERVRFPFLARQLSPLQRDLMKLMYVPRKWDKTDPITAAAMFKLSVGMMKKYGEPIPENGQWLEALHDLIDRGLVEYFPDTGGYRQTKKGIRMGAYLVQQEPPIKASLTITMNERAKQGAVQRHMR